MHSHSVKLLPRSGFFGTFFVFGYVYMFLPFWFLFLFQLHQFKCFRNYFNGDISFILQIENLNETKIQNRETYVNIRVHTHIYINEIILYTINTFTKLVCICILWSEYTRTNKFASIHATCIHNGKIISTKHRVRERKKRKETKYNVSYLYWSSGKTNYAIQAVIYFGRKFKNIAINFITLCVLCSFSLSLSSSPCIALCIWVCGAHFFFLVLHLFYALHGQIHAIWFVYVSPIFCMLHHTSTSSTWCPFHSCEFFLFVIIH